MFERKMPLFTLFGFKVSIDITWFVLVVLILEEYRVKFILTGGCGCNQLKELGADGIRVLLGMTGSVREAVEKFNRSPFLECCDSY